MSRVESSCRRYSGVADHQRADKGRDENDHQKAVESRADAAGRNAAEQKVEKRSHTRQRRHRFEDAVRRARARAGRRLSEERDPP